MIERNVIFGEAVEQYESARAGYPDQLISDVLAYAGPGPVLEVGAGSGKASVGFAARGVDLTCVEPDPRMAEVLRGHCPRARIVVGVFEDFEPDRAFQLLYCAQAWHWVDPERRSDLAHAALAPGGGLALFWNIYSVADPAVHRALAEIDARNGVDGSSLHRYSASDLDDDFFARDHGLAQDRRFTDLEERRYRRSEWYPAERYLDLIRSISAYRILPAGQREALLGDMAGVIGDGLDLTILTDLALARRA
ncbi:class I SAM-dependent methyltransferase [Nonomuraea soli]|uniref:SAM-dependent methyltransferase n=1 Tax=Nonomuraea soli TaxID=1032476 RepID=A0A7W0CGJ6_9ACTN|nr:class I SAM-dependent methyltransferase [Nonomuraea soli]MBA2890597.1 SAM-dependent methyltransferase [Nonomuraea soli]